MVALRVSIDILKGTDPSKYLQCQRCKCYWQPNNARNLEIKDMALDHFSIYISFMGIPAYAVVMDF